MNEKLLPLDQKYLFLSTKHGVNFFVLIQPLSHPSSKSTLPCSFYSSCLNNPVMVRLLSSQVPLFHPFFRFSSKDKVTLKVWSPVQHLVIFWIFNRLTPNDLYMSRTARLTSKHFILYIYSTSVGTEYFKHALYSPFFSLQNAVCFIMLTCLVPVLFTFYTQDVLKLKK